jgi:hypothetical protein
MKGKKGEGKKFTQEQAMKVQEAKKKKVQMYSFFNLSARWGWVVNATPRRFTSEKETRYPLYRRLRAPQGRSGRMRKISPPSRLDPRTIQPVASRYTDYAISTHSETLIYL